MSNIEISRIYITYLDTGDAPGLAMFREGEEVLVSAFGTGSSGSPLQIPQVGFGLRLE